MEKPLLMELPPSPWGKIPRSPCSLAFPKSGRLPLSGSTSAPPTIPMKISSPTRAAASGLLCPLQPKGSPAGQTKRRPRDSGLAQGWGPRPQAVPVTFRDVGCSTWKSQQTKLRCQATLAGEWSSSLTASDSIKLLGISHTQASWQWQAKALVSSPHFFIFIVFIMK